MIKSPECEICKKIEFKNWVKFGRIIGATVYFERVRMCKDCESKQKKVGEDNFGKPIYVEA